MKRYNIHVCYISWGIGGKKRPAVILSEDDEKGECLILGITSKYKDKSPQIQAKRLPIQDWEVAGLNMPSYIHLEIIEMNVKNIDIIPIGKLSERDSKVVSEIIGE